MNKHAKKTVTISVSRLVQILGAFFIVLVVIGVVGFQTLDHQSDDISRNLTKIEETRYQSCLGGVKIIIKFNNNQDRFKELATNRDDLDPQTKQALINAYNASKFEVPNCSDLDPDNR